MLTLLIPGPLSPGNDIHVYLQPLVKDLKELFEVGLQTYDAASNQRFDMKAALMSTISDFPAYAMLSGYSTKGKLSCPCCHYETSSIYINSSHKYCYMDHRLFLDMEHPWRRNTRLFHEPEKRSAPLRLKGIEIIELLHGFENDFGKKQKQKPDFDNPWRKMPIFLRLLSYWKNNSCPHYLDVMHIVKNVFGNII